MRVGAWGRSSQNRCGVSVGKILLMLCIFAWQANLRECILAVSETYIPESSVLSLNTPIYTDNKQAFENLYFTCIIINNCYKFTIIFEFMLCGTKCDLQKCTIFSERAEFYFPIFFLFF